MLWFNRVGIGLAILVTASSGLNFYEARSGAIAQRAEVTARNTECAHSKALDPKLSDDAFTQAFICGGASTAPPPIPTFQNAGQGWLSAMALVIGIWFVLWVFDFMAGGTERRAKSKSLA